MHRHRPQVNLAVVIALFFGLAATIGVRGQTKPEAAATAPVRQPGLVAIKPVVAPQVQASIESIFTLSVKETHLTFTPGPAAGKPQVAGQMLTQFFLLDGLAGNAGLVTLNQGNGMTYSFRFNASDDKQPVKGFSAMCNTSLVTVAGVIKNGSAATRGVQIIEFIGNATPGQSGVRMSITDTNADGQLLRSDQFNDPDFKMLLSKHPFEVDDYLRPVLVAMHQGDLLKYDPTVMSQVFLPELAADDKIRQQVEALLPKLSAEEFKERAKASADLAALGAPGAVVLAKLDRGKLSPEQDARVTTLLAPYRTLGDKAIAQLKTNRRFLLQCMDSDDSELRALGQTHLETTLGRKMDFDPSLPAEARHKAILQLEEQVLTPATSQATSAPS